MSFFCRICSFLFIKLLVDVNLIIADEKSTKVCKHRLDRRFHQNPPIENKLLRDVITNYEEHHANCYKLNDGDFTKEFTKEHKHMKCKYIIFKLDSSGLGNRVMGILSFYLMALLTDRVLLLTSHEYDITEVFCQPFPNSDWFIPMSFDLNTHQSKFERPDMYHYAYGLNVKDSHHPVIYIDSCEIYIVPVLFVNKHQDIQDRLHHWFPTKNVATVLIKYLLHPQNDIWEDIVHSWLINTRKGSEMTLGLQFRWGYIEPEKSTCLKDIPDENVFAYVASLGGAASGVQNAHKNWTVYQKYADGAEKHALG